MTTAIATSIAGGRHNGSSGARPGTTAAVVAGMGRWERSAAVVVVVLAAGLGVIGAVNSFEAVRVAVAPSFGRLAWTVPVGVDVGIAVFTGLDLLLVRLGMRPRGLRLVPWALVGVTVYLNVAGEQDPVAAVAHGVLPLLWVIAVETLAHVMRTMAGLTTPAGRHSSGGMDRVRLSRWLLAPTSTLRLWRRMVLWETTSYSEALRRERDRVLARTEMQDRHGAVAWRWRASRRDRALYRLGELTPSRVMTETDPGDAAGTAAPGRGAGSPGGGAPSRRRPGTAPPTTARAAERRRPTAGELVELLRDLDADYTSSRRRLTFRAARGELASRGLAASNGDVTEALRRARDHTDGRAVTGEAGGR